ncbi:HNH endonuclease [Terrabacter sp. LjRoot27]|uniref:HNH endonuclease signature motif containing protein n=1 Tax=Terrabacter sp. LjRoot27 TaxID=3342306 RepID=UPI003ECD6B1C
MTPFLSPSRIGPSPADAPFDETYTKAHLQIDLTIEGDRILREIEALEVEKAQVESDLLDAYAALHTVEAQQIAAASVHVSTDRIVADEIALATGVGAGEVARRLTLATAPRRHRLVRQALRDGSTSLHRALQVVSETGLLPDADVESVERSVLAPSRDGQVVPQRTFATRLRRAVASVDHRGSAERHEHAKSRRGVFGRLTEDGMGSLTIVAAGDVVAAVLDRLDTAARARRDAGDPRSLDQLRCDLAGQGLLRGPLEPGRACVGPDAPATAWLVVPFEVAIGESDASCELPGHGWVTARHARDIMTRPGSVWRTLPVDLRTGRALGAPTGSYRPPRGMVEHVRAVDGVCRGPDCEVLARRCDLDHEVPWPQGPTSVDNLHAKERFHHNVKTAGIWRSEPVDDDGLAWTTTTGRRYVTRPKDWRASLRDCGPAPGAGTDPDPPPF